MSAVQGRSRVARWLVLPAVVGAVVAGPATGPARGAAPFGETFGAMAAADAVSVVFKVPHAPASDTVVDAGGPAAQALLDSAGASQAFASFPWPGENTVTAPQLIAGASGGAITLPPYPFYVESSYPISPSAEAGSGPYSLKAESSEVSSMASASAGLAVEGQAALGLARSEASTISEADSVTAKAATEVTSFAVGPLRIGQVVSQATAVLDDDGLVTRTATTQVTGALVGETPVAITPEGVVLAGSAGPELDLAAAQELLKQARVSVEVMPRDEVDGGIVAPTVRVSHWDETGMSITYVLGGASAFAEGAGSVEEPTDEPATGAAPADPAGAASPPTGAEFVAPVFTPGAGAAAVAPAASTSPLNARAGAPVIPADPYARTTDQAPVAFVVPPLPDPGNGGPPAPLELAAPAMRGANTGDDVRIETAPASSTRRSRAARLLLSGGDTTPMFWVLGLGLAGLGSAVLLFRRAAGSRTR